MTTLAKSIELEEIVDPRNALIDAFEATITALVDNGFEAQLRARLARLLPPPVPEPDLFGAPADGGPLREAVSPPADDEIQLTTLIADCKRFEGFKMAAASHAAVTRMRVKALADLDAAKSRRAA